MSNKKFIFTITAGRTGTTFLANLFVNNIPNSEVHHEILGYDKFGVVKYVDPVELCVLHGLVSPGTIIH